MPDPRSHLASLHAGIIPGSSNSRDSVCPGKFCPSNVRVGSGRTPRFPDSPLRELGVCPCLRTSDHCALPRPLFRQEEGGQVGLDDRHHAGGRHPQSELQVEMTKNPPDGIGEVSLLGPTITPLRQAHILRIHTTL